MNIGKTLGDYDIWYLPCKNCGYDTAKSVLPKGEAKRCWKCGRRVSRDFTKRALKK